MKEKLDSLVNKNLKTWVVLPTVLISQLFLSLAQAWEINTIKEKTIEDVVKLLQVQFWHTNEGWSTADVWHAWWFNLDFDFEINNREFWVDIDYGLFLNDWEWRTHTKNRIDEISIKARQEIYKNFQLGFWWQMYWNFWWKNNQNTLHSLIWDTQIENPEYIEKKFLSPIITALYEKDFLLNDNGLNLNFEAEADLPIIFDDWTTNLWFSGTLEKEVFEWFELWIWAKTWLKYYPNHESFEWDPLEWENWAYATVVAKVKKQFENIFVSLEVWKPIIWDESDNVWNLQVWKVF